VCCSLQGTETRDLFFDAIRTSSTGPSERPTGAMHGRLREAVGAVHGVPVARELLFLLSEKGWADGKTWYW